MAFMQSYMWDGVTTHLDLQPIIPLTNPVEMNGNLDNILAMMKADGTYTRLFKQAFPDSGVTIGNMLKAMSQFMVMAVSSHSRFDKFRRHEAGGTMSAQELQGYQLFNEKCAGCHATDVFTDGSYRNNGLAFNPAINDSGRYRVTQREADLRKFRVPSLRNVAVTAPYMHDGRFGTLQSVLDHYASGVNDDLTLDPLLKHDGVSGIPMTADEKAAIIAFLQTLTDNEFLTDSRLSEF